ncbi:unnamed protein product [Zymoseptoria tritici ST99CH_1A5]|uniref:Extracellular membrane protein CFEM domain-containing protein n=1 Tax=Zymoseptoria tritici ST99CH_1A5 TaxID=1276529 RepID=A0A1Y6LNF0_ZYMTR|nr:unnamed protein product [Zymoseptoria tritici ST99CH_1A5]
MQLKTYLLIAATTMSAAVEARALNVRTQCIIPSTLPTGGGAAKDVCVGAGGRFLGQIYCCIEVHDYVDFYKEACLEEGGNPQYASQGPDCY